MHVVGVVLKPSGLHTLAMLVDTQVDEPGVQVKGTHAPLRHPSPVGHGYEATVRPSGLHTRRSPDVPQVDVPGTQVRGTQAPARHPCPAGQAMTEYAPPSGLHTRRSNVVGSQLISPGVHTTTWHVQPRQL